MAILGLVGTEQFASQRFKSVRRKVFYDYPNGAAPLTGLTSLLKEEAASDPEFNWWEKRMMEQRTQTLASTGGSGPFMGSGAAANNTWGAVTRTGGAGIDAGGIGVIGDKISIKVVDSSQFRIGHVVQIDNLQYTGPVTLTRTLFRVGGIQSATIIDCTLLTVPALGLLNNGSVVNNGLQVLVVGSAFAQGAVGSSISPYNLPVNPDNYCQIFRTEFKFTGTALKTSAKFDDTGLYKDRSKEASINHMIELEKGFIFGLRTKILDASSIPTYTTGGLIWFIEQWEKQNIANGGAYDYVVGATAPTLDTDDAKRIIANATGSLSEKQYDGYLERAFRFTSNKANEKLVLCGSGFLNVINQMYKSKSVLNSDLPLTETYGMDVVKHRCPFGTIYYKTHPLFSQHPVLRYNALILDVGNLVYRYVTDRDTDLLTGRQANDEDGRKDEWLSECGLEARYPESHMYLQNITDFTP